MAFTLNIKKLMKEKNVDQNTLANALGVSQGTISQWLTGRTLPRGKRLDAIADFFGVATNELLYEVDDNNEATGIIKSGDKVIVNTEVWEARERELMLYRKNEELTKEVERLKNIEMVVDKQ